MTAFLAALLAFFACHAVPMRPRIRSFLIGRFGRAAYLAGYSLVSLALLALLVRSLRGAPYVQLWPQHPAQYYAPLVAMPIATFLLAAGLLCPNPHSLGRGGAGFDPRRPGIVAVTRHPALWALVIWATSHIVPNGDLAPVLMFGSFAIFALMAMAALDSRKANARVDRPEPSGWRWPGRSLAWSTLLAVVMFALALRLHPLLIGPDPLAVFALG